MISVFLTSIRPHYWERFYAAVKAATSSVFEVVVTSPNFYGQSLPKDFLLVPTSVKPTQAMEAAARACRYPFIVQAVDDIAFDPGALDRMLDIVMNQPDTIATCKYGVGATGNGTCAQTEGIFGLCGEWPTRRANNIPLQPVCPMLRACHWDAIGGIDPIFGASYGDLDVYLRLIANGFKVVMTDDWVREHDGGSDLWRTKGQNDLRTIRSLWRDPQTGDWTGKRLKPPGTFARETLLNQNQGQVW